MTESLPVPVTIPNDLLDQYVADLAVNTNLVVQVERSFFSDVIAQARRALDVPVTGDAQMAAATGYIDVVFDGPPSHESGRFVEVEDDQGQGLSIGQWVEIGNYWRLRLPMTESAVAVDDLAVRREVAVGRRDHAETDANHEAAKGYLREQARMESVRADTAEAEVQRLRAIIAGTPTGG